MIQFTRYQKNILGLLAFLQFTIILDFLILAPLGAFLMPGLSISPSQFGLVVSVYAFSAGISGILAASFADRFDRKKLLLFFYIGFVFSTFLCGISPNYHFLLVSRTFTGLFGGVIGSIILAIAADLFPHEARGRVMGVIQTSLSVSQIVGLPIALFLANHFSWHAPFLFIVAISLLAGVVIVFYLKPLPAPKIQPKNPLLHLWKTLSSPRYLHAFATIALLSTGGFMIMPFSSAFNVHNIGLSTEQLPTIYLVSGVVSFFAGPWIGKAADQLGKFKVFHAGTALSVLLVLIYTNLGQVSLAVVTAVYAFLFIGVTARIISAQAMMSLVPSQEERGAFMAISSSCQQLAGGVSSIIAGIMISADSTGKLLNFNRLGFAVVLAMTLTTVMMYTMERTLNKSALQKTAI